MGGLVSSFAGAGSNIPTPPTLSTYQPQYTGAADADAFTNMVGLNNNNAYYANRDNYQGNLDAALGNPYAAGAQTAANTAGQQYATLGNEGMTASTALNNGALSLLPYVSQVTNTAADPQNALYNRTLGQVRDQANVSNAQNGLTGSPYGAGTTNAATSKFNIDWQNNQLARLVSGLGAASTGLGAVGSGVTTAQNVGSNAAANTGLSGAAPNATFLSNLTARNNALDTYGSSQDKGNANSQTAISDFLNYLSGGERQSTAQAQLDQQNYQNQITNANAETAQLTDQVNGVGDLLLGSNFSNAGSGNTGSSSGVLSSASSAEQWAKFLGL